MRAVELAGRILLGLLFLESGVHKALEFKGAVGYMVGYGVPFPELLLVLSILLELTCSILMIIGWNYQIAAAALALFVAVLTPIFHAFWSYAEPGPRVDQLNHFMKNLAILGGLLLVAASGRWPLRRSG